MKVSDWKQSRRRGGRKPKAEPVWPPPEYDLPPIDVLDRLYYCRDQQTEVLTESEAGRHWRDR